MNAMQQKTANKGLLYKIAYVIQLPIIHIDDDKAVYMPKDTKHNTMCPRILMPLFFYCLTVSLYGIGHTEDTRLEGLGLPSKGKIRTNVYLPEKLHEEARKRKLNLSALFSECLELEIYRESPEYLRKKIDELEGRHEREKDILLAQLKVAEKKQRWKKERMGTGIPKVRDYRTTTPSKRKEDR